MSSLIHRRDGTFLADNLTIADLSIWVIFSAFYLIAAGFCIPLARRFAKTGKYARKGFGLLYLASLFSGIEGTLTIGLVVYSATISATSPTEATVNNFRAAITFFGNWASPLLLAAVVTLLWEVHAHAWSAVARGGGGGGGSDSGNNSPINVNARLAATRIPRRDAKLFKAFEGFALFLFVLATISSGLYARVVALATQLVDENTVTNVQLINYDAAVTRFNNSYYVLSAFWALSALLLLGISVYVYLSAKRSGMKDKLAWIYLYIIAPLFFLGMLQGIIFTILFSPAVVVSTLREEEDLILANDILNNIFYVILIAVLIYAGFKRSYWGQYDRRVRLSQMGTSEQDIDLDEQKDRRWEWTPPDEDV